MNLKIYTNVINLKALNKLNFVKSNILTKIRINFFKELFLKINGFFMLSKCLSSNCSLKQSNFQLKNTILHSKIFYTNQYKL